MSYSIEQIRNAVENERNKWRSAFVYWKDQHGNLHPVPVVRTNDDGIRICIEIRHLPTEDPHAK